LVGATNYVPAAESNLEPATTGFWQPANNN